MYLVTSTCLCSELISVTYEDNLGGTHEASANLEEISSDAVTLLLDGCAKRGRRLSFVTQGQQLSGVVESCTWEPELGYFVAVRLDESCRWSDAQFTPEHMLCVNKPRDRAPRANAA